MKRLVTTIDADMFENTAVGLERQLKRRAGIDQVDVNRATHTVTVDFDNGRVEPTDGERLIAECGYRSFCLATETR